MAFSKMKLLFIREIQSWVKSRPAWQFVLLGLFSLLLMSAWLPEPSSNVPVTPAVKMTKVAVPSSPATTTAEKHIDQVEQTPQPPDATQKQKITLDNVAQIESKKTSSTAEILYAVVRVVDGDTIELENGERVRYIGIDTPESVHPSQPVECFGKEASQKNTAFVMGKKVRLEKDITDRDRYGRLLRYVYVGEVFINLELARQGYANSYTYPPDVKYQDRILAAEQEARAEKRGLWSACNQENAPSAPVTSEEPQIAKTPAMEQAKTDCTIKGNINAQGEKIYHLSTCQSYSRTKIDTNRGEAYFCSEDEARAAGWRKAENC